MRTTAIVLFLACLNALGQDGSMLAGHVVDPQEASVPDAKITVLDTFRGKVYVTTANTAGSFSISSLPTGDYSVTVEAPGFSKLILERVHMRERENQSLRLPLQVAAASGTSITVSARVEGVSTTIATGLSLDHDYLDKIPVNGNSVDSVIRMSPGIVSAGGPDGGVNANGMRSNMNYYTVDGVSANTSPGVSGFGPFGGSGGNGTSTSNTAAGTTSNLISLDALQEIRVETSTFAPEYGRTAGAQISMVSRGGTNDYHGSLYDYVRNDHFNASDWFANQGGLAKPKMHQNNFGGVLGGHIIKDKTFFFFSYEGLRLTQPNTAFVSVPDNAIRAAAPDSLRPYLNAFPKSNGPSLGSSAAQFTAVYSTPAKTNSGGLRVDHTFSSTMNGFMRIAYTPSSSQNRGQGFASPNTVADIRSSNRDATGSLVWYPNPNTKNDLRLNMSISRSTLSSTTDSFGGAVPLSDSSIYPNGVTHYSGSYSLLIIGLGGQSYGQRSDNSQRQINVVDSLIKIIDNHEFKLGADWRRLTPTYRNPTYSETVTFNGLSSTDSGSFLSGTATNAVITSSLSAVYPVTSNYSFYAQDTWKATRWTTITYGLRWDINPASTTRSGQKPLGLDSSYNLSSNEPLYHTKWKNIAPRFGLAYQMDDDPGKELIFRGGFGVFYDLGYGSTSSAFSSAPYSAQTIYSTPTFPLNAATLAPPSLSSTTYGQVTAADPNLNTPRVYEWSLGIEEALGRKQSVTINYVGTAGRQLIQQQAQPGFNANYQLLRLSVNGATSDYNGMQLQFQRRGDRLQMQLGYTWSHSTDTSSNDMGMSGFALINSSSSGDSNFDVRQTLSLTGSYRLGAPRAILLKQLLGGWSADWSYSTRTGLPFEVTGVSSSSSTSTSSMKLPGGFFAQTRPDLTGYAIWVSDPHVPGGRKLSSKAFLAPRGFGQGSLGRNALRGFGLQQLDFTFRRTLTLTEFWKFEVSAQGFNILNHPNFANPLPNEGGSLSSSNFGVVSRMLNQSSPGGLNAVYQTGGPRSMQLTLRLRF